MSALREMLLAHRLWPGQFIRLDGELFVRLEAVAAAQARPTHVVAVEAIDTALRFAQSQGEYERCWWELTPREQQVAALACLGYTNHAIANRLVISVNTVRSHMRRVLDKFDMASKAELRLALSGWSFADWE